jgi:hypothetical protein
MIFGLPENSITRMESPSAAGVAVAMAKAAPKVTAAMTTGTRVAGVMTH